MTTSIRGRCSGSDATACRAPRCARLQRRIGLLLLGFGFGDGLFEVLQRKIELVGVELLRASAELQALKLADEVAKAVILGGEALRSARSASSSALRRRFGAHRRPPRASDVVRGGRGPVHAPDL